MADASFSETGPPSSPPPLPILSRKRTRPDFHEDSNTSSDPPLFSSDPLDPSLDNYERYSRKRRYHGTWWGSEVDRSSMSEEQNTTQRSAFSRNFDSGVFMGSDESDIPLPSTQEQAGLKVVHYGRTYVAESVDRDDLDQKIARSMVQHALDEESELVDFTGLQLRQLPGDILTPLLSMTKSAKFLDRDKSPSEDDFESLQPTLQLYLAQNALCHLPRALWSLNHLTVLSLRNNNLTSLPPSIARLENLVELNVAGNRLRWLPWELLRLLAPKGTLRILTVLPNPLLKPFVLINPNNKFIVLPTAKRDAEAILNSLERGTQYLVKPWEPRVVGQEESVWIMELYQEYLKHMDHVTDFSKIEAFHMASTAPAYYDFHGKSAKGVVAPSDLPTETRVVSAVLRPGATNNSASGKSITSRVPTLFELATKVALADPSLPTLHTLLPEDTPDQVNRALDIAIHVRNEEGERICSVCGRSYVLPRTEWLEFWHRIPVNPVCVNRLTALSHDEVFLPFLRRGCSWGCVV